MQYSNKEFDPNKHDRFPALTVKQPYADYLVTSDNETKGINYAIKSIEVRSKNIKFRGDLLITSSINPDIQFHKSGMILGFVDLYDVKRTIDLTKEEWYQTCIPESKWTKYKNGYAWFMRNPRRVIEYPVTGQVGIWNLVYTKGVIVEYPTVINMDKEGFEFLNKK